MSEDTYRSITFELKTVTMEARAVDGEEAFKHQYDVKDPNCPHKHKEFCNCLVMYCTDTICRDCGTRFDNGIHPALLS